MRKWIARLIAAALGAAAGATAAVWECIRKATGE